jgi:hypothetical protein
MPAAPALLDKRSSFVVAAGRHAVRAAIVIRSRPQPRMEQAHAGKPRYLYWQSAEHLLERRPGFRTNPVATFAARSAPWEGFRKPDTLRLSGLDITELSSCEANESQIAD